MSLPQRLLELAAVGVKSFGKASVAGARQVRKNFKYKPELDNTVSSRAGSSTSGRRITSQLAMSLEEANMILNVKKEESMEVIQRHYDEIFTANGSPPEPPRPPATSGVKKPLPKPIYSHYMQSKVYRALERIKAERLDLGQGGGEPTPTSAAEGSAPITGAAPGAQ